MPRPCKLRRICALPKCERLLPSGDACNSEPRPSISMTVDEFESIRLIDMEGLTQEECALRMNVARTTAQAIYNSARGKLAQCLVYGHELTIGGGDYVLCDGSTECGCTHCHKRCRMHGDFDGE